MSSGWVRKKMPVVSGRWNERRGLTHATGPPERAVQAELGQIVVDERSQILAPRDGQGLHSLHDSIGNPLPSSMRSTSELTYRQVISALLLALGLFMLVPVYS